MSLLSYRTEVFEQSLSCSIDINGCEENNGNTLCTQLDSGATCTDVPAPELQIRYAMSFRIRIFGGECVVG